MAAFARRARICLGIIGRIEVGRIGGNGCFDDVNGGRYMEGERWIGGEWSRE